MQRNGRFPVIVIGASAGGIQALLELVSELPEDFGAPIFVVVHIGRTRSVLPRLVERAGSLPASHAQDGEHAKPGHIYVAPPDYHMLLRGDRIALSHGPRENHSRPAIDPLFRSAAVSAGSATTGIILSGALSDGSVGLQLIKAHGGTAIVQDPDEAVIGGMPLSALRFVDADHVLKAREIGRYLAGHPFEPFITSEENSMADIEDRDKDLISQDFRQQESDQRAGRLTMFTCPDCGGTLWQSSDVGANFRCHVGHTWGAETLLGSKSEELEAALWSSVRLLEERATLSRQLAQRVRESIHDVQRAEDIMEQAHLDERRADAIRELLGLPLNVALQLTEAEYGNGRSH
jgi:two-component system chemotaxis response regulator CheB